MCKIVELDSLTGVCGYFEMETGVNNFYGCTHKDCGDKVVLDKDGNEVNFQEVLRAHFRQYKSKKKRVLKKMYKKYKDANLNQDKRMKKFGCTYAGRCFSFSCPLAPEADLQDLKEYDTDLYNEWKDEEYDPSDCGANLMLICDIKLLEKL